MKKGIIYLLTAIIASLSTFLILHVNKEQTAYVNINEIYNEFKLKKELEQKYESVKLQRQNLLDSIKLNLEMEARILNGKTNLPEEEITQFQQKRERYLIKEKQFEEDNLNLNNQYTEQILNQINQYIEDYGKKSGYDFIFGASGTGSIMYASKHKDITNEVIVFVNESYKGI